MLYEKENVINVMRVVQHVHLVIPVIVVIHHIGENLKRMDYVNYMKH